MLKRNDDIISLLGIRKIFENGMFMNRDRVYSVAARFSDISYFLEDEEERKRIMSRYGEILNSVMDGTSFQILSLAAEEPDGAPSNGLDDIRSEYGRVSGSGKRYMKRRNFMMLMTRAPDEDAAWTVLHTAFREAETLFRSMGSSLELLCLKERLELISMFFGCRKAVSDPGEEIKRANSVLRPYLPTGIRISSDHIEADDRHMCFLYMKDMGSYVNDGFINEVLSMGTDTAVLIDSVPVNSLKAVRTAENALLGIKTAETRWLRKQERTGGRENGMPYEMERQKEEFRVFLDELKNEDQKVFMTDMVFMLRAADENALKEARERLLSIAGKYSYNVETLFLRQREAFRCMLPVGNSSDISRRTMITRTLSALVPFRVADRTDEGGIYYGRNRLSENGIRIRRNELLNGNSFILGTSGSGKSFMAKHEILSVFLNTDADIIVIDPEREYPLLSEKLGGETIGLSSDSPSHINPFEYEEINSEDTGFSEKVDLMLSIFSELLKRELTPMEKSVTDRCMMKIFLKGAHTPTLTDLYEELMVQREEEAGVLALSIELFSKGTFSLFGKSTNVDMANRLLVFDIKDIGKELRTIGMLIVLDRILRRIEENRKKNRNTYVFIDEIYLLFSNVYSSEFLFSLWKRVRKYGAFATGITQNVEDLLQSHHARTMLSNSELLVLLCQAPSDLMELKKLIRLTDAECDLLLSAGPGEGIIKAGSDIIPFVNRYPADSSLLPYMSTSPGA